MNKVMSLLVTALCVLCLAGCGNQKKYDDAAALMNEGKYEEAIAAFGEISDFEDAAEQIKECNYQIALQKLEAGEYDAAVSAFTDLGDYKDAADKITETKYTKGVKLYNDLDFEAALGTFKEIADYNDAAEYVEKCEYELSVDGKFMRALSGSLMARWDYGETAEAANSAEEVLFEKLCDMELEKVEPFYDQPFENEELGKAAAQYIDYLRGAKESLKYYTVNYSKFADTWAAIYENRTMLISRLVTEFGLTVDEKHQSTLDGVLKDAVGAAEHAKVREQVDKILDTIKITRRDDEWGTAEYTIAMENVSEYTFEYFDVTISVEQDDTYITESYINAPANWAPGKKISEITYFDKDFDPASVEYSFSPSYNAGGIYQ